MFVFLLPFAPPSDLIELWECQEGRKQEPTLPAAGDPRVGLSFRETVAVLGRHE